MQSELQLQAECFQYTHNHYPNTRKRIWHVTNEMKPHPGETKTAFMIRVNKAKAAGLVPGVSDLHFFWKGQLHVFELKVRYNGLSPEQEKFKAAMLEEGAEFYEIRDFETFKSIFNHILNSQSC